MADRPDTRRMPTKNPLSRRARDMAVLAPFMGTALLMPPLIGLFARPDVTVFGVPLIVAYLTMVWIGMIGVTLMLARRLRRAQDGDNAG